MSSKKHLDVTQGDLEWLRRVRNLILNGLIKSPEEIPDGAIPADLTVRDIGYKSKDLGRERDKVHYGPVFYADQSGACTQCGEDFLFTAQEQLNWYEVLKLPVQVTPGGLCPACRKKKRESERVNDRRREEAHARRLEERAARAEAAFAAKDYKTVVQLLERYGNDPALPSRASKLLWLARSRLGPLT